MEIGYGELLIGINEKYGEEVIVETSVGTADRGGASKVLSVEAEVKATGVELLEREADVSGKVNYRLLYLDKQDRLCGLDYFKDFKCRVAGEKIAPSGSFDVRFEVPDAGARIDGDTVELSAVVDISIRYFGEEAEKAVTSIGEAEYAVREIVSDSTKKSERLVDLEKTAEIGVGVKKIVLFAAEASPVKVSREEGLATAFGEVVATVLYLNEADEAVELSMPLPFAEKFEEEGRAAYRATVKNARVILTDGEDGNMIEVEATIVMQQVAAREITQTAIRTACGEKQLIEEKRETLRNAFFKGQDCFAENLSGAIPLAENAYVAFVRPGCHAVAEVTVREGGVRVEGVAAFQVIYQLDEGYGSMQGEFPFGYDLAFPAASIGDKAEVLVEIGEAKATFNGKEAHISAKAAFDVALYREGEYEYLSEATEGDLIPESEAGISVYFAEKGEDLYDIARTMGVLPSALVNANPFLAEPLTEDRKVLIFRKK